MADNGSIPAGGGIAELGLEDIVVRHGKEADVDLPLLTSADTIHRRLHIIVDPAPWDAAKDPEAVPLGIKQHLVGLQQIGAQQESPAVRQLDVGHLQLRALAAQNGKVLAPVELEGLAWAERQRNEGPAPCRLLLALAIRPP